MLLHLMRVFSFLYACVVFVDFVSKVKDRFIANHKAVIKSVFSNIACICVQKSSRTGLSVSF